MGEEVIALYDLLFWLSLGLAGIGLIFSIVTFFAFDIRTIFAIKTGHAEKLSMKKTSEKNAATGQLKEDYSFEYNTMTMGRKTKKMFTTGKTGNSSGQAAAETTQLNQKPAPVSKQEPVPDVPVQEAPVHSRNGFVITENVMVIHTNEVIEQMI